MAELALLLKAELWLWCLPGVPAILTKWAPSPPFQLSISTVLRLWFVHIPGNRMVKNAYAVWGHSTAARFKQQDSAGLNDEQPPAKAGALSYCIILQAQHPLFSISKELKEPECSDVLNNFTLLMNNTNTFFFLQVACFHMETGNHLLHFHW